MAAPGRAFEPADERLTIYVGEVLTKVRRLIDAAEDVPSKLELTRDNWARAMLAALSATESWIDETRKLVNAYAINEAGLSIRECARIMGASPNSVTKWARDYNDRMDEVRSLSESMGYFEDTRNMSNSELINEWISRQEKVQYTRQDQRP